MVRNCTLWTTLSSWACVTALDEADFIMHAEGRRDLWDAKGNHEKHAWLL
jgi:hypothetical protein